MAKILVNYPSRSRPHKFFKILNDYHAKSSGKHELHYLIKVDADDLTMNNSRVRMFVSNIGISHTFLVLDHCKGKIDAINRSISDHEFDIVVCIADDMDVIENNWDDVLVQDFAGDYSLSLNYNTDPRLSDYKSLVVLPIIGKQLYDKFGYVYHPDYVSEYCDNEQTEVFESLGKLKHIDRNIFNHDWWGNQDALMQRNMNIGRNADRETYNKRKGRQFV
jgi:hypothetical protein